MARDQLDLRGKTMTELMEMDKEAGNGLSFFPEFHTPESSQNRVNLLADRRQVRKEMESRKATSQ